MKMTGFYTTRGLELAAALLQGSGLTVTRVVAGSGETLLPETAALADIQQTLAALPAQRTGTTVTVPATLLCAEAPRAYRLTEVGVYALDGQRREVLYKVYRMDEPLPVDPESPATFRFYLEETVSGEADITVDCAPAGVLLEEDFHGTVCRWLRRGRAYYHVSRTGSNETGDGSEENPFLTVQHAVDVLPRYLTEEVTITIHEGAYEEVVRVEWFGGPGMLNIVGAAGETVSLRAALLQDCTARIYMEHLTISGEMDTAGGGSVSIWRCVYALLNNITCVAPSSAEAYYGAIRAFYSAGVYLSGCTVSNKNIAIDVLGSNVYLNDSVTGTGNTVAYRCGSGWGSFGAFLQLGGATVAGTQQTAYGGQIF